MRASVVESPGALNRFATTRWSLIRQRRAPGAPSQVDPGLAQLCQIYWRPIFTFILRRGYSAHDAQDLTQDFFVTIMEESPAIRRGRTALNHGVGFFVGIPPRISGKLQAARSTPLSRSPVLKEESRTPMKPKTKRTITVSLTLGAALVSITVAQETPSPTPTPTPPLYSPQTISELKQLQQAALKSDYAYQQVAHLSNNIGGRLSGSVQAQKAVDYVAGELKALGLEVQLEKIMVPHWVRGEETAALVEFPGMAEKTTQKIVLCALGTSVATPAEGLTAEVIVARDFDELEALGKDKVAGKIVLFNYHFDKQMAAQSRAGDAYSQAVRYRADGASAAGRLGAIASLIRSVGGADFRLPHTGQNDYKPDAPKIPAAAVTAEDADLIAALVPQGTVRMHLVLTPQTLPDAPSFNVIGDLKGSEHPEQVVVVSGHLDSWDLGTGAIDDGAGVAVSMEAANLVQKLKFRPKRTIRVIAWMNEENGLAGGKTYAKDHEKDIANHFAVMETDGGAGHPLGINYATKKEARPFFEPIAKTLQSSGASILNLAEHPGADISPLTKLGVPGFSPIQDNRYYFNFHHTAADTLDKIVPQELAENAAVVAVTAYALANLEKPFPR